MDKRPETKPVREAKIVEYKARDGQQVRLDMEVCKNFLVRGKSQFVTTQEFIFFMGVCKSRGVNPFAMDCYLIKYAQDGNAAIIVSRGHYQASAKQQQDCQGWSCGVILRNNGELEYREGHLVLGDEELVGGWFEAQPKGWLKPKRHTVPLAPYIKKTYKGETTQFWQPEKQGMMIEKVAEVQGLRSLWSREFANLHILEEIVEADSPTNLPTDPGPGKPRGTETKKDLYKKEPVPAPPEKSTAPDPEQEKGAGAGADQEKDYSDLLKNADLVDEIAKFDGPIIKKVLGDYSWSTIGGLTLQEAKSALKACHALKNALDAENIDDDTLAALDKKIGQKYKDCTLAEKYRLSEFLFIRTGKALTAWTADNLDYLQALPLDSLVFIAHAEKWERFKGDDKITDSWPVMPEAVEVRPAEAEPEVPTHFNCVGCLGSFPAIKIVWGMDSNQPHCKGCMEAEIGEDPGPEASNKCGRCGWDNGEHHEMCPDAGKTKDPKETQRQATPVSFRF